MTKRKQKDYKYFNERVDHYVSCFGLKDWRIYTNFKKIDTSARVYLDHINQAATVVLSKRGDRSKEIIDLAALHEVIHIVVADLSEPLRNTLENEKNVESVVNRITGTLRGIL